MNEREQAAGGGSPTRKSLELTLPDDVVSLKRITAELMVERAILERELELVKSRGRRPQPTVTPAQDPDH